MAMKLIRNHYNLLELTNCLLKLNLSVQYSGKVQLKVFQPYNKFFGGKFKENKAVTINTLTTLLDIQKPLAIDLVSQHNKLSIVPANIISDNYHVLHHEGITNATVIKFPDLLACMGAKQLKENLDSIKKLPYELNDCACLVALERSKLQQIIYSPGILSRIDSLIRKLEANVNLVMEGFVKCQFLYKINLDRLEEVIDLLKSNHVSSSDIVKDWWVLQYTPKTIQERIEICHRNNIDPFKTWMVRCTADILGRYIQRRSDNKLVLGDSTLVEYLAQRLQCTSEEARSLMVKHPALQNKSMKKMKEIIDFLYVEGFQPYHIRRIPKILLHSVQTTKKRIRELEQQGVKMDSLHMLTKSQRQYMQYYQALVKSNTNKPKPSRGTANSLT